MADFKKWILVKLYVWVDMGTQNTKIEKKVISDIGCHGYGQNKILPFLSVEI